MTERVAIPPAVLEAHRRQRRAELERTLRYVEAQRDHANDTGQFPLGIVLDAAVAECRRLYFSGE